MRAPQILIATVLSLYLAPQVHADDQLADEQDIVVSEIKGLIEPAEALDSVPADPSVAEANEPAKENPCEKVNLDEAQKAQIKTTVEQFKTSTATLRDQTKASFKSLADVIKDPTSDINAAKAASLTLASNMTNLMSAAHEMKLNILYNIMKPEQRAPALSCMMMKKYHKMCSAYHGRRHHRHHQHETHPAPTPAP